MAEGEPGHATSCITLTSERLPQKTSTSEPLLGEGSIVFGTAVDAAVLIDSLGSWRNSEGTIAAGQHDDRGGESAITAQR